VFRTRGYPADPNVSRKKPPYDICLKILGAFALILASFKVRRALIVIGKGVDNKARAHQGHSPTDRIFVQHSPMANFANLSARQLQYFK
jgi:hypothetical protein